MVSGIIEGLVYSYFDEKIGPVSGAAVPSDVDSRLASSVAERSLSIMGGHEKILPRDIEILSLPGTKHKILVKCIHHQDPGARGGIVNATVSLIFKEEHDVIFYKYFSNFNELFDAAADSLTGARGETALRQALSKVDQDVRSTIEDLRETEFDEMPVVPAGTVAFPDDEGLTGVVKAIKAIRCKIIVCGDPQVGKTSSILRFTDNAFRRTYLMTIGVNLSMKTIVVDDVSVELTVWDVAGQAKFQVMRKRYYENARGFLLVFDKTRRETFENVRGWAADIRQHLGATVPGLILANKSDLTSRVRVDTAEINKLASNLNIPWLETSAKDGTNVTEAFERLAKEIVSK